MIFSKFIEDQVQVFFYRVLVEFSLSLKLNQFVSRSNAKKFELRN